MDEQHEDEMIINKCINAGIIIFTFLFIVGGFVLMGLLMQDREEELKRERNLPPSTINKSLTKENK